jgi:hypothetical protein
MISNKFFLLTITLFLAGSLAQADEIKFQRIRTFDPVRGLVPGNIPASLMAPKLPVPATAPPAPSAAPPASMSVPGPGALPDRSSNRLKSEQTGPANTNVSPSQATDQQDLNSPPDRSPSNGLLVPDKPDSIPSTTIAPPDAPKRPPLPPVDSNAILPQVENVNIKPALSWRAKAFRLASLPDNASDSGKHPSLIMNGSIEDSLNALAQVCKARGVQLLGKSIPAGQLGARMGDATSGRYLLLFVAKKISTDRTLVKACMDPDSRPQKAAILQDVLSQAASIVDGKGLL